MPHHPLRNQMVAGAFVLLMAAAVAVILVLVGGWQTWFEDTRTLRIRFETAPNIKTGGPILMAGHPVGRVTDVAVVEVPCPPTAVGKCYQVEVVGQIPTRFTIYENARIVITQSLMGQSAINIEEVGFGKKATGAIQGAQASPFAAAADELGIGVEEKQNIKEILRDLRDVAADAKQLVALNKGEIAQTLQNFRETSEHLKATAKEVRRAPWRLLARPDKAEVESLNLYDAARAFASAATDLDALADTLQAMIEAKEKGVQLDPETLQAMLKRLEETFTRYEDAETALWQEFERIQK
ncbi:MAG: MlaD family protein [Phycisphaerae bacterium]